MALEFFIQEEGKKKYILTLNEKDLNFIGSAIANLEEKTGVNIDEYGDGRLYPNQVALLVSYIENYGSSKRGNPYKPEYIRYQEVLNVLKGCVKAEQVLYFEGD